MTYQIIITEETAANITIDTNPVNVNVSTTDYPIIINYNAVIEQASGNTTYGDSNVRIFLASGTNTANIITTGNVSGAYILGNGSQLTGIAASYGNANVAANLAAFGSNPISTTGNITAGYVVGNGSLLSNLTGANVTGTVANATYALNSNAATFATQATFAGTANAVAGANVSGTVANATYALNSNAATFATQATSATTANAVAGANVSGTVANATYALNSNAATFAGTVTTAAQPNITSVGILTALNTSGAVSATGNITSAGNISGNFILGNGSQLTGLPATYGNANVAANLAAFATNPISTSGNVTAGFFLGDGSQLTNLPAGTYGNANVAAYLPTFTGNVGAGNVIVSGIVYTPQVEAAVDLDLNAAGKVNINGNIRVGDNNTNTQIATHGIGDLILRTHEGDASQGSITIFDGANGNIAIAPNGTGVVTATTLSATGNITGANLVATANLTSTQQTVVGTANVGTTGNIVLSGRNMATDMVFSPDGATGANLYTGRVMVGTGWAGNNAVGIASRLTTMDMISRGNTASLVRQFESESLVNLTANVTNTGFRHQAIGARIRVGGGSAANVTAFGSGVAFPFTMAAAQLNMDIGNASPYFLGNTSLSHAALNSGAFALNAGSSIGNAYGYVPFVNSAGTGGTSNITNYIGVASSFAAANVTGNLFCFYNGNTTSVGSYAVQTSNNARAATNYYFLRNDDDVAQVKLGSLRSYNEFQYATATSGTVNIDKTNAQVQFVAPTANVTIGDFQNFVSTANDGTNNDTQTDTVTLIIQQGATPYTVTLPTGNASIKYAGGISTVGTTANAVTMVNITAFRSAANATLYLTTVSSEFV
jgi:hypothetical protein